MEVILDGALVTDRATLHDLLAEKFDFPDYYGRNLDALYDMLTGNPMEINVTVIHTEELLEHLGRYGKLFLQTLQDASQSNAKLKISIIAENI